MADVRAILGKTRYTTADLREITAILRGPGGCPWDAAQTHESIRKNFIEETYEVVEAINKGDDALLCEELGDILLQVALHAQMADERAAFNWEDVTDGICRKLIERHPHVFGQMEVDGAQQALQNWDAIKRKSKGHGSAAEAMKSVPRELPALMRAQKIQHKAAKAGFDWREIAGPLASLEDEIRELRAAISEGDAASCRDELGDILFSAVNVARFLEGCDAEEALTASADRFLARFASVEHSAMEENIELADASIEELDRLWDLAKRQV